MLNVTSLAAALVALALSAGSGGHGLDPTAAEAASVHAVAPDGSADFTSIQAAVDAAASGDTVVVRPGTYTEAVVIDQDLSLVGEGPREEIVIAATADPERAGTRHDPERPYAILLTADSVTVADLTVWTPDGTNGVVAMAGAPRIERVRFFGPEELEPRTSAHQHRPFTSMGFFGETSPTIADSEWDGYVAIRGGASATFSGNTIHGESLSVDGPGETSVLDNTFIEGSVSFSRDAVGVAEGNEFSGDFGQIGVDTGSVVEVRGNTFSGSGDDASVWVDGPVATAVISGNTVTDSQDGVRVSGRATVTIEGNTLDVSSFGIAVSGAGPRIEGNTIESDGAGILIFSAADPVITGNTVDAGTRAIVIGRGTSPTISGNTICGGEVGLWVEDGADPQLDGNEICGEGPTD